MRYLIRRRMSVCVREEKSVIRGLVSVYLSRSAVTERSIKIKERNATTVTPTMAMDAAADAPLRYAAMGYSMWAKNAMMGAPRIRMAVTAIAKKRKALFASPYRRANA